MNEAHLADLWELPYPANYCLRVKKARLEIGAAPIVAGMRPPCAGTVPGIDDDPEDAEDIRSRRRDRLSFTTRHRSPPFVSGSGRESPLRGDIERTGKGANLRLHEGS